MRPLFNPTPDANYAFLLVGLLFLFLTIPVLHMLAERGGDIRLMRMSVQSGFSGMMLISVWGLLREKQLFRIELGLALLSVSLSVVGFFRQDWGMYAAESVVVLFFCVVSGLIAARHVFGGQQVDRNTLYGAMCVYLLMGLGWATLYTLLFDYVPGAFTGVESPGHLAVFDDFLYFSFVTLASLGYGDITPAAPLARTLAYLEVIAGQFYIAIMVAGLVGLYLSKDRGGR